MIQHQKWEEYLRDGKTIIIIWGFRMFLLASGFLLIVMKTQNIHFLVTFLQVLPNFRELLATFLLKFIQESKRVSGVACEYVVCQLGKLLNLFNLYQSKELIDLVRRDGIYSIQRSKDQKGLPSHKMAIQKGRSQINNFYGEIQTL